MPFNPQDSRERRSTKRVALQLTTELRFSADGRPPRSIGVVAEVIDACQDGRGLSLWLPPSYPLPLGQPITLVYGGQAHIRGIVVSRLGSQARYRVGIRVHDDCHGAVRELVMVHSLPPATLP